MSSKETIIRIIKEETNFMRLVLRRVLPERLESEFEDSLHFISKMFLNNVFWNLVKIV